MTTENVLKETKLILSGLHPAYRFGSDNFNNATCYLHQIGRDLDDAKVTANDILEHLEEASEISELHPDRCKWIANRILEVIK